MLNVCSTEQVSEHRDAPMAMSEREIKHSLYLHWHLDASLILFPLQLSMWGQFTV